MRTKGGLSSEIVFCMSPNKNVGVSLKAFGISAECTTVVLVVPRGDGATAPTSTFASLAKDDAEWERALAAVQGERRPLAELDAEPSEERAAAVRALYGIEKEEVGSGVGGERPLLEAVVNSESGMGLRRVVLRAGLPARPTRCNEERENFHRLAAARKEKKANSRHIVIPTTLHRDCDLRGLIAARSHQHFCVLGWTSFSR